jgi:hypothetical protein
MIPVSANTVARLLYQMDFSLRVNRQQIATHSSPYRGISVHWLVADQFSTPGPAHHQSR